jgi:uncharacterized protein (DUF362 family)/Pyruvate/2-oxoacid:ferredoxin oxidoreductase delta subunit
MMKTSVALIRCRDYSAVDLAVEQAIDALGGWQKFVRPGQTVLIKPNLLTRAAPEKAKTTHPEVVRAVIRAVRAQGSNPVVGDSPASVVSLEKVWEETGIGAVCAAEGVPLLNFEKSGSVVVNQWGMAFNVARPVKDADVIISVPKVKTHILTLLTGAVKNMYGTIPGFQKTALHKQYPDVQAFGELLAAIYTATRPALVIADGIVGMEGEGPSAGEPVPLGFLAASADGAALDMALCAILGIRPQHVTYLAALHRRGGLSLDAGSVAYVGEHPAALKPARFRVPSTLIGKMIPAGLVRVIRRWVWIRPSFDPALCIRCRQCVRACPAEALALAGEQRVPELTFSRCIECCCCHEVCPVKAVSMRMSPLLNFFRRGRLP